MRPRLAYPKFNKRAILSVIITTSIFNQTHNPGTASIRMDIQDDNNLDLVLWPDQLGEKLSDLKMSGDNYTFNVSSGLTIGN